MEDCPLCGRWDCECQGMMTDEEFEKFVKEIQELEKNF